MSQKSEDENYISHPKYLNCRYYTLPSIKILLAIADIIHFHRLHLAYSLQLVASQKLETKYVVPLPQNILIHFLMQIVHTVLSDFNYCFLFGIFVEYEIQELKMGNKLRKIIETDIPRL